MPNEQKKSLLDEGITSVPDDPSFVDEIGFDDAPSDVHSNNFDNSSDDDSAKTESGSPSPEKLKVQNESEKSNSTEEPEEPEKVEDFEDFEEDIKSKILNFVKKHWVYLIVGLGLSFVIFANLSSGSKTVERVPMTLSPVNSESPPVTASPSGQAQNPSNTSQASSTARSGYRQEEQPQYYSSVSPQSNKELNEYLTKILNSHREQMMEEFTAEEDFLDFKGKVLETFKQVEKDITHIHGLTKDAATKEQLNNLKAQLNRANDKLSEISRQDKNLSSRIKKIEDMPVVTTSRGESPEEVKKQNKIRYKVPSAMDGQAWVISKATGKLTKITVGENLKGYGRILRIRSNGTIDTVSGRVLTD